jgi:putative DNA methylase
MTDSPPYRKKLIEVALPLEAINRESVRESYIYRGNPSAAHKWWAQRALAACRAVLFASLVDDPSSHTEDFPSEEMQDRERQRLFRIIEELVKWENSNDQRVLETARAEIRKATGANPPPVLDPFCGGGSIPLEAQRLGLGAIASDLNPVAVLITKALVEIPPRFAGHRPVNPESRRKLAHSGGWKGAQGLAEDVRYYGQWMREEAEKRIGHLYPKVKLRKEYGGGEVTAVAWLWARTVKCPNPSCGGKMPLVRSFWLSTKKGKQAWVAPAVNKQARTVRFDVETGNGEPPEGTVNRRGAICLICRTAVPFDHVRVEGRAGRMDTQLMAIVAEGPSGRVYTPPTETHERVTRGGNPTDVPETDLPERALGFRVQLYGMKKHRDLFTLRQLLALETFSDLTGEARERVIGDAVKAGLPDDGTALNVGGTGATAYADAIATYLAFATDKVVQYNCTLIPWYAKEDRPQHAFARQAIPMVWDFAEMNPLSSIGGSLLASMRIVADAIEGCGSWGPPGCVNQLDAAVSVGKVRRPMVFTDPPYYDNIGYADLSDFFYVWLRRCLGKIYPDLFSTLLTPKAQELVATPYRFGGDRDRAREFFEESLAKSFLNIRQALHPDYPMAVYYAFRQSEEKSEDDSGGEDLSVHASTGWETMLEGLLRTGFVITGTWPVRTERGERSVGIGTNALASSVVLICRPRDESAPLTTRREFLKILKGELPDALRKLQRGNIAPVDLAQAAIGPGMAVFSRYAKVVEADGSAMRVRIALGLINQVLDEVLAEQESEYDQATRWAVAWFEQYGTGEGPYGDAETLSKAKDTAVDGLAQAGILEARGGKVRLFRHDELDSDWNPVSAVRLTVWEVTHQLIRALEQGGERRAADLLQKVGSLGEIARDLAYRLYTICERKKWAKDALGYNALVVSWPEITRLAGQKRDETQLGLGV